MTRRKKLVFAFVAILLASTVSTAGLLIVDVYLHGRYERSAGYNVWGYRGPSTGAKQPGEVRVAVLGGSTAYGYGVNWEDSIPALLERLLAGESPAVTVVNLGYNNEGAHSLKFTLEDYLWLDYDIAVLYDGYNDVTLDAPDANRQVFRRDSPVFRWTGYLPIFPIIFKEKAAALLTGGNIDAAYDGSQQTVFKPGLAARGAAGVLSVVAGAGDVLQGQVNAVASPDHRGDSSGSAAECQGRWSLYCESVAAAIAFARSRDIAVLFVGQPELHPRHADQQQHVAAMIARRFAGDNHVHYVSARSAIDLTNPALSFDGMHLTAEGNRLVAQRLAPDVRAFVQRFH